MLLKTFIHDFYLNAVNGKEKTRALLEPFVTDEALFEHVAMFEGGFPRYRIAVEDMIEEGNKIAVRARFQGTHTGNFNGIPPTGKTVDLPFMIIYMVEGQKIVQHWLEANQLALLTQLGVMSTEPQPA